MIASVWRPLPRVCRAYTFWRGVLRRSATVERRFVLFMLGVAVLDVAACMPPAVPVGLHTAASSPAVSAAPRETLDEAIDRFATTFVAHDGSVAVLEFPDLEQRLTSVGKLVSQSLTTALVVAAPGHRVRVLERLQVDQMLKELNFQSATITDADVERVGRALGADALIFGTTAFLGGNLVLNVRMVEVRTRSIVAAARATVEMPSVPGSTPMLDQPATLSQPSAPAPPRTVVPSVPHGQLQRRYDWEYSIDECTADRALLDCTLTIRNLGPDRFTRVRVCNAGVMEGNLQYCSRAYLGNGIVRPLDFLSATQPVGNGSQLGEVNGLTVLTGRSVTLVLRSENPPHNLRAIRQLSLMVDVVRQPGWAMGLQEFSFTNVTVAERATTSHAVATSTTIGFRFDLLSCRRTDRDVECSLAVSNYGAERTLGFDESHGTQPPTQGSNRAFDDRGNVYALHGIVIGESASQMDNDRRVPAGDTLGMHFRLVNVDPLATSLTTIELYGRAWPSYPYNTAPVVVFRAVPVTP